jgi:diguanylate cyclase (GGDEF)-like protein
MEYSYNDDIQREDFTIFDIEEALLERSLLVLADETTSPEMLRAELRVMTTGYQRLFREVQRLIKISDRKEEILNRLNRELTALSAQLEYQASHDDLTGIFNKGAITRYIDEEITYAAFGLILFDIDYFKQVNDQYGHPAGDAVLKGIAERINDHLLPDMVFARFGGEEFAIVAPYMPLEELHQRAENIRHAVNAAPFFSSAGFVPITISFGVSLRLENESFSSVFTRADKALYQAKQEGRNRVTSIAPPSKTAKVAS